MRLGTWVAGFIIALGSILSMTAVVFYGYTYWQVKSQPVAQLNIEISVPDMPLSSLSLVVYGVTPEVVEKAIALPSIITLGFDLQAFVGQNAILEQSIRHAEEAGHVVMVNHDKWTPEDKTLSVVWIKPEEDIVERWMQIVEESIALQKRMVVMIPPLPFIWEKLVSYIESNTTIEIVPLDISLTQEGV